MKASQQMPQEQKPQIRPDMLRMGLLNVWKVAPQTRPQWDDSSELYHSMQVPQAIFVAFQQRCLWDLLCVIPTVKVPMWARDRLWMNTWSLTHCLGKKQRREYVKDQYSKAVNGFLHLHCSLKSMQERKTNRCEKTASREGWEYWG